MTLAVPSIPAAPSAFHLLARPAGALCNLDCAYCFFLSELRTPAIST
jgi:serine-type anaerobic sulfatase-maturating enzyme